MKLLTRWVTVGVWIGLVKSRAYGNLVDVSEELFLRTCLLMPQTDPAMWYHGGDQAQARYFSRFIAISIKASVMGLPLPVYSGES